MVARFIVSILLVSSMLSLPVTTLAEKNVTKHKFVMQLTRGDSNHGHRRAFMQIDKVLSDLGEDKLEIVVVAYEDGIHALLADNKKTSQLLTKLANRGVSFRACKISMNAWQLKEDEFPLEVEFIPAGAPEIIRLQMEGYKYWRP